MRLFKISATIAAIALISLPIIAATTAAQAAAGDPPVIQPFEAAGTLATDHAVLGNSDPSAMIDVFVSNADGADLPYCSTVADTGGAWSCPPADTPPSRQLAIGVNSFTATALVGSFLSPASAPQDLTVYGPPTLLSPEAGSSTTSFTPTFSGTAPPGASLSVVEQGNEIALCSVAVVAADSSWSCTPTLELGYGVHAVTVTAQLGLDRSSSELQHFSIVPPAPTMSYALGNGTASATATGVDGADLSIQLYSVTENAGEGYTFGEPVQSCPTGENASTFSTFAEVQETTTLDCDFGPLAPGIWNVYSFESIAETTSTVQNDFFRVPVAPSNVQASSVDAGTATISGLGTAGDLVEVTTDAGEVGCAAQVTTTSSWSCVASAAAGSHSYHAYQVDQGFVPISGGANDAIGNVYNALSTFSETATVTVLAPVVVDTPPATSPEATTPSPPATPVTSIPRLVLDWSLDVSGADHPLQVGDSVTLSSSGLPAGATVSAELHSTPVPLGSTTVAPDGTFTLPVVIPDGTEAGDHHFVVTVTAPNADPSTIEMPVTVVDPPAAPIVDSEPTAVTPETTTPVHHGGGGVSHRNQPDAPSSFTDALPTLADIGNNPIALAIAAGLALAIMLLVAIPTEILNSTITSNLDRFGSFISRAESAVERASTWLTRVTRTPAVASGILILLSSIIFGFADPGYGFDIVSLRLTLSLTIAMFVVSYLASRISGRFIERRWEVETEIGMQPIALVFAIVGVVLGRLLGFSPGFLIGLAIGLELSSQAKSAHRAKALVVQVTVVVGLALLAWCGYSLIVALLGSGEGTFWTSLVQDSLVSITTEGLTGMLIALLPLGFLEGRNVWEYSKALWVGLFFLVGLAFAFLVLPSALEEGSEEGINTLVWISVLAGYAIVTFGLWLFLRYSRRKRPEPVEERTSIDA